MNAPPPFAPKPALVLVKPEDLPPVQRDLVNAIRRWHSGKIFNVLKESEDLKVGEQVRAPWVGIECIDTDSNYTFYVKSDVTTTSDDDDVAAEIWEHCCTWVKGKNDGLLHNFMVRCLFSDPRGFAGEDFWNWALSFGSSQGFGNGSGGLRPSASMTRPGQPAFRTAEDHMLMHGQWVLAMHRELVTGMVQSRQMDQAEIQNLRAAEQATRAAQQQMVQDSRSFELDAWTKRIQMQLLGKFVDRMGGIVGPYATIAFARWAQQRFAKKKSNKESQAELVIRGMLEHFRKLGGLKTKEDFEKYLDNMKIEGELREDVLALASEYVLDEKQEQAEEMIFEQIRSNIQHPAPTEPLPPINDPVTKKPVGEAHPDGTTAPAAPATEPKPSG
jgi:type II secretory pathway pseudopilin PulG